MRSKQIYLSLFLLLLAAVAARAQDSGTQVMNLEQCLEYAFEHNETLMIANLEKDKQKAYIGEIAADGLPQINGTAELRKNLAVRTTFIPARFFDEDAAPDEQIGVQFGTAYEGLMGIDATQLIFDGSYFVGLRAARTLKELTSKDHIKTKIDVAESVSKAYYSVLVAEEAHRLTQSNYHRLDSLLRETRIMHENGFVERIDLNRTQVEFNNIAAQLKNQQRLVEYSRQLLKFQMGMPLESEISIADKPSDLSINYVEDIQVEADPKRRVEYDQLLLNQELARLDLRNNHVQYLPTLNLIAGVGINAGTQTSSELFSINDDNWFDYSYVGLSLSLPIFDGLRKSHKIQQNRIELQQIDQQFRQLKKQINLEVMDTETSLLNNMNNLKNQQENMELAEEVYNVSKIKYQEGVGSSTELMDADNAYKEAQSNYYNALLETLLSKVEYEKALGILIEK